MRNDSRCVRTVVESEMSRHIDRLRRNMEEKRSGSFEKAPILSQNEKSSFEWMVFTPDWQFLSTLDSGDNGNKKNMMIRGIIIEAWP